MPIYAYRCASCGHAKDVLQKVSDAPLTVCPSCGAAAFAKQLTAPGFQLKGSGWYATDFKGNGAKKPAPADSAKTDAAKTDATKSDTGKAGESGTTPKSGDSGTSSSTGDATPASGSSGPKAAGGGTCAGH